MNISNRTLIIIGLIITFVIVPVVTGLIITQLNNSTDTIQQIQSGEKRSDQELLDAIVQDTPTSS